jgi:hypothetical protein
VAKHSDGLRFQEHYRRTHVFRPLLSFFFAKPVKSATFLEYSQTTSRTMPIHPSLYDAASENSVGVIEGLMQNHQNPEQIKRYISDCRSVATKGTLAGGKGDLKGEEAVRELEERCKTLQALGDPWHDTDDVTLEMFTDALRRTAEKCYDAHPSLEHRLARNALRKQIGWEDDFSIPYASDVKSACTCVNHVHLRAQQLIDRTDAGTAPMEVVLSNLRDPYQGDIVKPLDKPQTSYFLQASHHALQEAVGSLYNCPETHTMDVESLGTRGIDVNAIDNLASMLLHVTQRQLNAKEPGTGYTTENACSRWQHAVAVNPEDYMIMMERYAQHMASDGLGGLGHV